MASKGGHRAGRGTQAHAPAVSGAGDMGAGAGPEALVAPLSWEEGQQSSI